MLFGDKASEIVPNLLPGAELLGDPHDEEQNIESELKGEVKGKIKEMREMLLRFLRTRFSDSLVELAEQVLSGIENVEVLDALGQEAFTSDEQDVRASLT